MLDLPATPILQADVDRLEAVKGLARARLDRDLGWAHYRLELGFDRDTLQGTRPPGCWCLGLGGRTETALTIFNPDAGSSYLVPVWRERCPHCPEGQAAETLYQQTLRQSVASVTAQRLKRVFGQPSLREYQDATLDTLEVLPENQLSLHGLQDWLITQSTDGAYIYGLVGTGKTHLAVALLRARVAAGDYGLFLSESAYLQAVRDTYQDDGHRTAEVQHAAWSVPFLVLDDVGAELLTPWAETQVRALLTARLTGQLPTLMTSNYDPLALRDVREERIVSRVLGLAADGAHVYPWLGPDRRERRL